MHLQYCMEVNDNTFLVLLKSRNSHIYILAICTTAVEQGDITMTTDLPTAATDLLKLFSDITDYFLSSPVEYARTTVISEIAQFTASNLSYVNDSAECGVAIIGNFSKMTKKTSCKFSLYCR